MSTMTGGISRCRGATPLSGSPTAVVSWNLRSALTVRRARVGDLDAGVEVHVGRAEVADGERVAAEVDRLEAVVHRQLRAHRVVHAGAEQVRLGPQQLAHARARPRPA